ncbi:hypothetical protein HCN51_54335 [Nonomuraea sp. FMUSA5-5]|uniref:Uncharacterized protein n=1 Tax=Nonomuraea composti TaxID=2720023 RepID=A0ABX1BKM7_9ACTN|nr:hypothetical protein [Nonomuraea sp. FMUSA5-5]NJP98310.1 hypothetical protein [Nonomuraea sp. FMUSA5-5]
MDTRPAATAGTRPNMRVEQRPEFFHPPTGEASVGFGPVRCRLERSL